MAKQLIEVPIPSMGATVNEITLVDLFCKAGSAVAKGEKLAELEARLTTLEAERDAERERALQAEVRALDQSKRRDAEEGQTTQQAKSEIQAAEKRARGAVKRSRSDARRGVYD